MSRLGVRVLTLLAGLLLFGFYALANFVPKEQRIDSALLPDGGLRLGLDLRGGIHWVLGVELDVRVKHELETLGDRLNSVLEDDGLTSDSIITRDGQLIVEVGGAAEAAVERWASDTTVLENVGSAPLTYELTARWRKEVRELAMAQVLEVLRNRIAAIKVETPFDLEHKKEVKPISSFFIKQAQANVIERIPNYADALASGGRIGPLKPVKRTNPKTSREYWTFAFENDEDYK